MNTDQLHELLYQALETEQGGIQVYLNAVRCALNADLKKEWKEYLEQTKNHERIVRDLCEAFGLDPGEETPGRKVVRHIGESLVRRWRWRSMPVRRKRPRSSPPNA
jgi:rubrerythrin